MHLSDFLFTTHTHTLVAGRINSRIDDARWTARRFERKTRDAVEQGEIAKLTKYYIRLSQLYRESTAKLKVQDPFSNPKLAYHEKQKSAVNDVTEHFFRASKGLSPTATLRGKG